MQRKKRNMLPLWGPVKCQQPSGETGDGVCNKRFNSCCEYSIHFRNEHHHLGQMKCLICKKILANSTGEETAAPYPCKVCGEGFQLRNLLTIHVNTEHAKLMRFECGVCHKRFTTTRGLQKHMRMHTGDRHFPCTLCEKSFTQKSRLNKHLSSHTNERPYQCVVCNKAFKQTVYLKDHMRTHTNLTPVQCIICDKRFKQSSYLTHHLMTHSEANMNDDQKKKYRDIVGDRHFPCTLCEKSFTQKSRLNKHLRSHTNERPCQCVLCNKAFKTTVHLKQHMRTHTNLTPVQCIICDKRFKQGGHLTNHLMSHSEANMNDDQKKKYRDIVGDRPFTCTFCEKSFIQKSRLNIHLRCHTNETPYQCVVCNKAFKQTVYLKQHMRTHTNLTPFQCIICDKRFKQGGHLTHHLNTHSEANMNDDQKKKYRDIVGLSGEETAKQTTPAIVGQPSVAIDTDGTVTEYEIETEVKVEAINDLYEESEISEEPVCADDDVTSINMMDHLFKVESEGVEMESSAAEKKEPPVAIDTDGTVTEYEIETEVKAEAIHDLHEESEIPEEPVHADDDVTSINMMDHLFKVESEGVEMESSE